MSTATKGLTVLILHDSDVDSPLEHDQFRLHSFGRRHLNFTDPSKLGLSYETDSYGQPKVLSVGLRSKLKARTAWWCSYYEHGNCLWFLRDGATPPGADCRWDGVRYAGLLIWEGKPKDLASSPEDRTRIAGAMLDEYSSWCNGETYWYQIQNEDGESIESCGGYIGTDFMFDEIARCIGDREFEVSGDYGWAKRDILNRIKKVKS